MISLNNTFPIARQALSVAMRFTKQPFLAITFQNLQFLWKRVNMDLHKF